MNQQDLRTFKEGLDTDTEDRDLPPSRYRYAKNALSGSSSTHNVGSLENVQGNTLRNLLVGEPTFNEDFADNGNTWLINQNLILPPCNTTIGPNLQFEQDTLGVAEQGNVLRSMLATDHTYRVSITVTTPTSTPLNGSMKVYLGENDTDPYEITAAGTYTIEKPANGSKLIIEALFSVSTLLGQTWNVTALQVISQDKALVLTGTNKVIGSCKDIKNNAIIYMVYNSENKHKFLRFYINTKRIEDLLPGTDTSVLGWTPTSYIWNAKIVETGSEQLLFFLDETTKLPRRLNTSLWENRGSNYAYTLVEDDISVAKKPPHTAPTWEYVQDINQQSNFIADANYQFRYRWIYEDGEISSLSPISTISIQPIDEPDTNYIEVTVNSGPIQVQKVQVLRRVGDGASETGTTNPEWYIFETIVKADAAWSDNTNYAVDFYNTENLLVVSRTDTDKNFEVVPQTAGAQEIVEGNQPVYLDIEEGYGNIETNTEFNVTYDLTTIRLYDTDTSGGFWRINLDATFLPTTGDVLNFEVVNAAGTLVLKYRYILVASAIDAIGAEIAALLNGLNGITASYNNVTKRITTSIVSTQTLKFYGYTPDYTDTVTDVGKYQQTSAPNVINGGFTEKILLEETIQGIVNKPNDTDFDFESIFEELTYLKFTFTVTLTPQFIGLAHTFDVQIQDIAGPVILYYRSDVIFDIETRTYEFYVPADVVSGRTIAIAIANTDADNITYQDAILEIDSVNAPIFKQGFKSGVKHEFGLVYFDEYMRQNGVQNCGEVYVPFPIERTYGLPYNTATNDTEGYIPQIDWEIKHLPPDWAHSYCWAYRQSVNHYVQFRGNIDATDAFDGSTLAIKINSLALYEYIYKSFAVGDIVRVLYDAENTMASPLYTPMFVGALQYLETKIVGLTETEIIIDSKNGLFNISLNGCLFEVYSRSNSELFFEFSPVYGIGNPTLSNRYHEGPTQNQDPLNPVTVPATGPFTGATYFKTRGQHIGATGSRINNTSFIEAEDIDDSYESNYWNRGRVQIETPNQKQQRLETMVRWGGKLFQDTQINNMSTFDEGNYKILSAKFGAITAAREIGYTLKILQEANYSTAFIGRREIQNADGSTQLVVTDSLIGNVNYSEDEYGTKQKGSVVVNDRNLYFFDTIKGVVVRESGNTPFPISNYYMVRYFSNKALEAEAGDFMAIGQFDDWTSQLWFHMIGTDYSETLCFEDRDGNEYKRWKSWQDMYVISGGQKQGVEMLGSIGRSFVSYLNGYPWEHYQYGYLNYFGVQRDMVVKSVFNISPKEVKVFDTHSIHANMRPGYCIFTVPAVDMYPYGMKSKLMEGNYKGREGVYYSEIKGDGYSTGFTTEDSAQFRNGLVNGRNMRGHAITAEMTFITQDLVNLYSHEIGLTYSPKS